LFTRESGIRVHADNPTSTAFGIGQLLEGNRKHYAEIVRKVNPLLRDHDTLVPIQQFQMAREYCKHRYGTCEEGWKFWQNQKLTKGTGWY